MSQFSYINWNVEPILIDFGTVALRWYSLLFLSGFVVSFYLLKNRFIREKVAVERLEKLTIYVAVGTVIGARLGHCLFYDFDYYRHHLLEIFLPVQFNPHFKFIGFNGLASHGGALGILVALLLFSKKYQLPFLWLADKLALVVPFAGCCIRLGNLMNSEIIGKPTNVPWAFIFEREDRLPRHPSQVYEAIAYLLIGLVLLMMDKRKQNVNGFLFGCFLACVFCTRFLVEFTKENQSAFEAGLPLNMGQLLSVPLVCVGVWLLTRKNNQLVAN